VSLINRLSQQASGQPVDFDAAGRSHLERLIWLRGLAIIGLSITVGLAQPLFQVHVPLAPPLTLLSVWAAINLASWLRLKRPTFVSDKELLAHLLTDIALLTGLLAFSGGPANPLTSLYLPPVAVAAAILPARKVWLVAATAVLGYSLLWGVSTPMTVEDVDSAMRMHLTGMWLTFAASAVLIAGFISRITQALRKREFQLAKAREQALRDERIVALGNLAASAAHELGTPLATMAVLAGEMAEGPAIPDELRGDMALLRRQIAACKDIITSLAERAGSNRAESGGAIALDRWIEKLVARWRSLRPRVAPRLSMENAAAAPSIFGEATLEQALLSLLNNAADASPGDVDITAIWSNDHLRLQILDRGPGMDAVLQLGAGREFLRTRPEGAGIGLFLAQATLNRYGGEINFKLRSGGGTVTHVSLPLKHLLTTRA